MSIITTSWLEARAAAKQAQLLAIDAAILALSTGAQSYTLDTGQSRQQVTKADLAQLRLMAQQLESELATIDARLCGASVRVVPDF